ncbi:MAG TPA: polysaccharide deacetylase family protein [Thermoanaerobaculaceae bacterium]|nr:polysaccharide deacetylase family protein [Thermoanaerobaculaceae bacterium]HPS78782.1 polysaccharide deacetylase family protein [Thermoanaerobaculaceae bacterium]
MLPPVLACWLTLAAPPGLNITSVPAAGSHYALTFDAHSAESGARELLALLRERRVRATIFVTGRFATDHADIVRLAAADGHEIGNHTFTHPHLTTWATDHRNAVRPGVTRAFLQDELRRTAEVIELAIGHPPSRFWRAPYGEHNATIRGWAEELGLVQVDWTRAPGDALDSLDWVDDPHRRGYMGAEAMARRILGFEARYGVPLAGSIILMHLGSARPEPPLLEAVPIILDEADRRGLRPVTVGELVRLGALLIDRDPPGPPRGWPVLPSHP